jgi:hypothetical protein
MSMLRTKEGAVCYDHSLDHAIEFFSKAGSLYSKSAYGKKSFYNNQTTAVDLFKSVWCAGNHEIAMKLLFWLRDARGGAGNRSGFRECLTWLVATSPNWISLNIDLIVSTGRWDDLRTLFNTPAETAAVNVWVDAIANKDHLACKWADRTDKPLLRELRIRKIIKDIGDFRRLLASGRNTVVERKMCSRNWNEIEYPKVPSVAMARYTNAFGLHDPVGFAKFKEKLETGEVKINASVLFPHDCVRTSIDGDTKIADAQFDALPDYMENKKNRILCLCDSSGSMDDTYGGSVKAIHVSMGISLYCSDRVGSDNPFYRKFLEFESETRFTDWKGKTFSQVIKGFNGACGATRINIALDSILSFAKMFNVKNDQMPNCLLILSDMQFHDGNILGAGTEVEKCMQKWVDAGYNIPNIVYWNLAGCAGSPATVESKNVALVSGFSPSILNAIFSGEDFSPRAIMLRAIDKYKINTPV